MKIFFLKTLHTLVTVTMFFFIGAVWRDVILKQRSRLFWWANIFVLVEGAIWVGNGRRCPLTEMTLAAGGETGDDLLADYVWPAGMAKLVFPVSVMIYIAGIMAAGVQYALDRKPSQTNS